MIKGMLAAGLVTLCMAAPYRGSINDHIGAYNFMVEISGVNAGYFKSAPGLGGKLATVAYQDGDDIILQPRKPRKTVTLTSGHLPNDALAKLVGKEKRDVKLPLVFRPDTAKWASKQLCTYTLHGARVKSVKARKIKHGKQTLVVHDVSLTVERQSHTCAKYFRHPSKR